MKKAKIENYEELKKYREGKEYISGKDKFISRLLIYTLSSAAILGLSAIASGFFSTGLYNETFNNVMVPYIILASIGVRFIGRPFVEYSDLINNEKAFKKKYPNVNMDISDKQLDKIIEYKNEKKLQEDIEKNKDSSAIIDKLSVEDKIKYLEEQKEFWEALSVIDDYKEKNKVKIK